MPLDVSLDSAFARIAGVKPAPGRVRLLKDGAENYPAWLEAIRGAKRHIHFENFIIASDATGRMFAEALKERARAGVRVRVVYDWLGSAFRAGPAFWSELREAGAEVRAFNAPRLASPFWIRRTHRKLVTVDGEVGFVGGLCVADVWQGRNGEEPWRDTGIEVRGSAVADLDLAFAETWALSGERLPALDPAAVADPSLAEAVPVRVIAGRPYQLATYRLDQLIAAGARRTLWLTDAYFVATGGYVQALAEAARDGVDVRLLVPSASDVPFFQNVVRPGYRPLIEAGVRVFEWNGSMLHAKTAVADGRWSRIGSTNLNLTSWVTNWELDVMVEDARFAAEMEAMYLADLANATEIVLGGRARQRRLAPHAMRRAGGRRRTVAAFAAGAVGLPQVAGTAISARQPLTPAEAKSAVRLSVALLALAALITAFPVLVVSPLVLTLVWIAAALLIRAWRLQRQKGRSRRLAPSRPARASRTTLAEPAEASR